MSDQKRISKMSISETNDSEEKYNFLRESQLLECYECGL